MKKEGQTLDIVVIYPAARDDLKLNDVDRDQTLGQLKTRVLEAFELTEGTTPDGTVTSYVFYHEKDKLEDLSRTVGQIAGHHHKLRLKLAQQIVYG